jgi:hypothetical protein
MKDAEAGVSSLVERRGGANTDEECERRTLWATMRTA